MDCLCKTAFQIESENDKFAVESYKKEILCNWTKLNDLVEKKRKNLKTMYDLCVSDCIYF